MSLYFITGNKNKFLEAKEIIPDIVQIDLDLKEIQELDSKAIIREKLTEAIKKQKGEFFCEDTSLYIDCLNGFPGPLIKWFLQSLGNKRIYELVSKHENRKARAVTMLGYTDGKDIIFFEGEIKGTIVSPKGETNFGWDPIFLPDGQNKTFAEMTREEKTGISHRTKALQKFRDFLSN